MKSKTHSTLLLYGKDGKKFEEIRTILSKEEKTNYY